MKYDYLIVDSVLFSATFTYHAKQAAKPVLSLTSTHTLEPKEGKEL